MGGIINLAKATARLRVETSHTADSIEMDSKRIRKSFGDMIADAQAKNDEIVRQLLEATKNSDGWFRSVGEQMTLYIEALKMLRENPTNIDPAALTKMRDFITKFGGKLAQQIDWNALEREYRYGWGSTPPKGSGGGAAAAGMSSGTGYSTGTTVGALK